MAAFCGRNRIGCLMPQQLREWLAAAWLACLILENGCPVCATNLLRSLPVYGPCRTRNEVIDFTYI
jgi:hypothetical protein